MSFFAVQAYHDHKLNHMPDTSRGEYSQGVADKEKSINLDPSLKNQDWKRAVAQHFPPEYHDYFDFNLLVKTFQDCNNVSIILDTSPFKWQFPEVDLTIFDLSPLLEENIKQYEFWKNKSRNILIGAYNHQQEFIDYAGGTKIRKDYVLI